MRIFLAISAVLAWAIGLALLFTPAPFLAPMGITVTPAIAVTGQTQGAILVGLGTINWLARAAAGAALRAVLAGNLVVQSLSWIVVARALALGIVPAQNAGAIVIHTVLGAGFAYFLWRAKRTTMVTNAEEIPDSR
jgi:hypothetical protein